MKGLERAVSPHSPLAASKPFGIPSNIQLPNTITASCADCFNKYSQHVSVQLLAAFRRVG